jgi:NAD(P)-dependent dehydrogenase (short-subunit alcohol dehydrogenase family)
MDLTAVVTGATSGIGKEIARGLVRLGATVVLGARDEHRGAAAKTDIGGDVVVLPLDVADLASIREFATTVAERFPTLHLLVNNAGAWYTDRKQSPDGYELTFATNVLGPYLLTELLQAPLRAAGQARIVNVVSGIANNYDATDLQFDRRLADTGVTANAAAPGFVRTGFNRNAKGFRAALINMSVRLFAASPTKGADTPLWVATAPELRAVSGKYFTGRTEKDGGFHDQTAIADLERRCAELTRTTLMSDG